MAKKQKRVTKKTTSKQVRSRKVSSKREGNAADLEIAPEAVQKFVNDIRVRGESGLLKSGKLGKGVTHEETKEGLKRARVYLV
jgi:hypothetical protein